MYINRHTPSPGVHQLQQVWGGTRITQPDSASRTHSTPPTMVAPSFPGNGFIPSSSDLLFNPLGDSTSPRPYVLHNIPHNPPFYPAYNHHIPANRPTQTHHPPHVTTELPTSYNNPHFVIPPPPDHVPTFHQTNFVPFNTVPSSNAPLPPQTSAPVQYVYYVPSPSSSIPSSRSLPTTSHVPLLTCKADFFTWNEGVTSLLRAHGLLGHILDPTEPVDPSRPDRMPTVLPILPLSPSPADHALLARWWDDDNAAQHVLISRLGAIPSGLLPSSSLVTRTALLIYQTLVRYYGTSSFADCAELLNSLNVMTCSPGRLQEYVSKWRTGVTRLQSAKFPFSVKLSISQFVRGLPALPAFNTIRANLPSHIALAGDQDFGSFVSITEQALELDTIFRSTSHPPRRPLMSHNVPSHDKSRHVPSPSVGAPPPSNTMPHHGPSTPKLCTNCHHPGHLSNTCFAPGGGMEGQRDAYRKDRNRMIAMLVASLDDACGMSTDDNVDLFSDVPGRTYSPFYRKHNE